MDTSSLLLAQLAGGSTSNEARIQLLERRLTGGLGPRGDSLLAPKPAGESSHQGGDLSNAAFAPQNLASGFDAVAGLGKAIGAMHPGMPLAQQALPTVDEEEEPRSARGSESNHAAPSAAGAAGSRKGAAAPKPSSSANKRRRASPAASPADARTAAVDDATVGTSSSPPPAAGTGPTPMRLHARSTQHAMHLLTRPCDHPHSSLSFP